MSRSARRKCGDGNFRDALLAHPSQAALGRTFLRGLRALRGFLSGNLRPSETAKLGLNLKQAETPTAFLPTKPRGTTPFSLLPSTFSLRPSTFDPRPTPFDPLPTPNSPLQTPYFFRAASARNVPSWPAFSKILAVAAARSSTMKSWCPGPLCLERRSTDVAPAASAISASIHLSLTT